MLNPPPRCPLAFTLALLGIAALQSGCGGSKFDVAPVSGKVTLDGEPLCGARIGFEPISLNLKAEPNAGPGSYAVTDDQGRFVLTTLDDQIGAVVGQHRVSIHTAMSSPDRGGEFVQTTPERVPARYNNGSSLKFTVPAGGTDAANFDLTTSPIEP